MNQTDVNRFLSTFYELLISTDETLVTPILVTVSTIGNARDLAVP